MFSPVEMVVSNTTKETPLNLGLTTIFISNQQNLWSWYLAYL